MTLAKPLWLNELSMKVYLVMLFVLTFPIYLLGQEHRLGVKMSISTNNVLGDNDFYDTLEGQVGFDTGLKYSLISKENIKLDIGFNYGVKSFNSSYKLNVTTSFSIDTLSSLWSGQTEEVLLKAESSITTLNIPIKVGYEWDGKFSPFLSVGMITSIKIRDKHRSQPPVYGLVERNNVDEFTDLNLGLVGEIGVNYKLIDNINTCFSLTYEEQLTQIVNFPQWEGNNIRWRTFLFNLGIEYVFGRK